MSNLDNAKALIQAQIVAGKSGSITAAMMQAALIAIIDGVVGDRTAEGTAFAPAEGLTSETVQDAIVEVLTTIESRIAGLIGSAGPALNTLEELAAALGDDADFAATITSALAAKVATASIVNDLTTGGSAVPLSAQQGVELKALITAVGHATLHNAARRNGGFEVWQRGTSIAVAASSGGVYTADGWYLYAQANQASVVAQAAGLADGSLYAAKVQRNSGQTGTAAMVLGFPMRSSEVARLRGKKIVASAVLRAGANWSPASGRLTIAFITGTGSPSKRALGAFTGDTTVITTNHDLTPGGAAARVFSDVSVAAVPSNATVGEIYVVWAPTGTAGADDSVTIDDVQIDVVPDGVSVAQPALHRPAFFEMVDECLDFYRKTFDYATAPGQNLGAYGALYTIASGTNVGVKWQFGRPMRVTPTITTYSPDNASANWANNTTRPTASVPGTLAGDSGVTITGAGATDLAGYYIHASASAEI